MILSPNFAGVGRVASRAVQRFFLSTSAVRLQQQHKEQENVDIESLFTDDQQNLTQSEGGDQQQLFDAPKKRFNKGINRVELLGGVGSQPLTKQTAQGSAFASFNLYTNVERRLGDGTTSTNTEVHNVVAFGSMAKYVEKNVERGTRVYLTGRLHYTGGALFPDGTRSPRICSVSLESIYPLSKSGAIVR